MKSCPDCGAENRDTALFCHRCSRRLPSAQICPNCGRANPPDAQFCNGCSYSFGARAMPAPGQTGLLRPQALLVGRYRILRRVGQGGMGAVYEAEDLRLPGKRWAVKEMSDAAITDPAERADALDAFDREAHFLSSLSHANLPKVMDSFASDGKQYLVMEFVDGQTLEELVAAGGPLPTGMVVSLGADLCGVLDYLHRRQPPIIFRDLKPGNIMIDSQGNIKLIDFGIARLFTPGKQRDTVSLGTKGYAAPEQYGKGQTDARSDVYALGATLHFLLTGRDPADDPFNFPPVRALNGAVSPALEAVVAQAVRGAPAERWQSAREMRRALTQALPAPAAVASQPTPSAVPSARRSATASTPPVSSRPAAASTPSVTPPARSSSRVQPRPASRPAASRPAAARAAAPHWRESGWFYLLVVGGLAAAIVFLHELDFLGPLFPLVWFTLSMLAGIVLRQIGAIGFTWLSIPLYNSIVGQTNDLSWAMVLSLIVPIELFFLLTRYRLYTPVAMLSAAGLGILGLYVITDPAVGDLVLSGVAVALGSLIAYVIDQWLEPLLT